MATKKELEAENRRLRRVLRAAAPCILGEHVSCGSDCENVQVAERIARELEPQKPRRKRG